MTRLETLSPAKSPTPKATIANIEINLLKVFFISLKKSLKSTELIFPVFSIEIILGRNYHSRLITSAGAGFACILSTFPFFIFITRSAIAVNA